MKRECLLIAFLTSSFLMLPFVNTTAEESKTLVVAANTTTAGETAEAHVVYQPPLRGAPSTRVGGGTRGASEHTVLSVFAPDHVGLTTQDQPTLYWFTGTPVTYPVELTIIDDDAVQPLLEVELQPPVDAGIHALSLDDAGVRLEIGKEYQWFVAIVKDPTRRSSDIVAGGAIKRVEPSATLRSRLAQAQGQELPLIYATEGIWYDAIGSVSQQIDTGSGMLREQRVGLLEQVGLQEAASYDNKSPH